MNYQEELEKMEAKYQEMLASNDFNEEERAELAKYREMLKGHVFDITYLRDFVKDIPNFVSFRTDEEEVVLLVGVVSTPNDFVWVYLNEKGEIHYETGVSGYILREGYKYIDYHGTKFKCPREKDIVQKVEEALGTNDFIIKIKRPKKI